jgi:hypothetical protein
VAPHQFARTFFGALELRPILGRGRYPNPERQPAAQAMRRQLRTIHQWFDQGVHAIAQFALLARLGVKQHDPAGGKFEVGVEFDLEQAGDPLGAAIAERVARREHQQSGKQACMRQEILPAIFVPDRSIAQAGKRLDVLGKSSVAVHRLAGHQERRGAQGDATWVRAGEKGVLRRGKRLQRVEFSAMRLFQAASKQRSGVERWIGG